MHYDDFFKGWLVGDFDPAIVKNKDVEVAVKYYKANEYETRHVHNICKEYTIILIGKVLMNGIYYNEKEVVYVEPKTSTDFLALEDTITLVIKTPSIPSDKELI